MAWSYAELSKKAKLHGGPEEFMEYIVKVNKKVGRIEMVPVIGGAFVIGVVGTKVVNHFRQKKDDTQAELDAAKAEIIAGIKEYDENHPEESDIVVGTQDDIDKGTSENR